MQKNSEVYPSSIPKEKTQNPNCLNSSQLIIKYQLEFLLRPCSHFSYPQLTPQMLKLPSVNISIVIYVTCSLPAHMSKLLGAQRLWMSLDIQEINAVVHLLHFLKH